MSDVGRQIEQGSDGPEWEQYRRPGLTKCESAELDRLRDAVAFLKENAVHSTGSFPYVYVWQRNWHEFKRRVDG
jgi:hypothetical protein